jgi:beta-xylosidase
MKKLAYCILISCILLAQLNSLFAQNPLILDQFTADPSARVFESKVYIYPSHDIPCPKGRGFIGFCMPDYHVFSSENLTDWKDHGVIISQNNVPWVDSTRYSLWAPDCIEKDGKYYFYFPAWANEKITEIGMRIGVAISDSPYGPFVPEPRPIEGVFGIDPNPFIDKDGQAYLYWAGRGRLLGSKLKENMIELASEPQEIKGLPAGFKEGPYLFERNGIYYFTYPYVKKHTERLDYAIGDNPMGPFTHKGVIMDESPTGCWTNHHSIIAYKGQWVLFYHHNDLSPKFDKNRSIRIDSLFFNNNGSIQKVIPTWRGVGLTDARKKIQIDRYSAISVKGADITYLDKRNKQKGWKTVLNRKDGWIRYNGVDFGDENWKSVQIKALSKKGGVVDIQIGKLDGPTIAHVEILKNEDWINVKSPLSEIPSGIHNLVVMLHKGKKVQIDWIRFE